MILPVFVANTCYVIAVPEASKQCRKLNFRHLKVTQSSTYLNYCIGYNKIQVSGLFQSCMKTENYTNQTLAIHCF